jgi:predicted dehydrogenase
MSENNTIGFGIIGCGVIGPTHADAILANQEQGARLLAVFDTMPEAAKKMGTRYNVQAYNDLAAFLAHPDLQVVNICVPSGLHAELGVRAAKAGKHVIVEKPLDILLASADHLIQTCREHQVKLAVISQHRFCPAMRQLQEALQAGRMGDLVLGDAIIKWYRTQQYYDSAGWRGTYAVDGGGALMNQGIHYVDLLQWVMGPVKSIRAVTKTLAHEIEVEDVAIAILQFENGAIGTIQGSTAVYPGLPERLEISGRNATVVIEADKIKTWEFKDEKGETGNYGSITDSDNDDNSDNASAAADPAALSATGHAFQVADMIAAIHDKREPALNGEEARKPLEIILAIYQSSRENREVFLPL